VSDTGGGRGSGLLPLVVGGLLVLGALGAGSLFLFLRLR